MGRWGSQVVDRYIEQAYVGVASAFALDAVAGAAKERGEDVNAAAECLSRAKAVSTIHELSLLHTELSTLSDLS